MSANPDNGRARLSSSQSNSPRRHVSDYEHAFSAVAIACDHLNAECPFCALDLIVKAEPIAGVRGDHVLIVQCTHCKRPDIELAKAMGMPLDQVRGRTYKKRKLSRAVARWKPDWEKKDVEPPSDVLVAWASSISMVPCLSCRRGFIDASVDVVKGRSVVVYSCSACDSPVLPDSIRQRSS